MKFWQLPDSIELKPTTIVKSDADVFRAILELVQYAKSCDDGLPETAKRASITGCINGVMITAQSDSNVGILAEEYEIERSTQGEQTKMPV